MLRTGPVTCGTNMLGGTACAGLLFDAFLAAAPPLMTLTGELRSPISPTAPECTFTFLLSRSMMSLVGLLAFDGLALDRLPRLGDFLFVTSARSVSLSAVRSMASCVVTSHASDMRSGLGAIESVLVAALFRAGGGCTCCALLAVWRFDGELCATGRCMAMNGEGPTP